MFYRYFFFLSCFFFFFFCRYFPLQTVTIHKIGGTEENHYFSCFPPSPANENSFNWSRFLPFIFNSIYLQLQGWYLMRLVVLRYLHFICIFMDAIKSELLTLTFESDLKDLSLYQTITLLLQRERLNKLRFTPQTSTVYLSHLISPTPSRNLSSNRYPKCI